MLKSSNYVTNLYLKEIEIVLLDSYVIDAQKNILFLSQRKIAATD